MANLMIPGEAVPMVIWVLRCYRPLRAAEEGQIAQISPKSEARPATQRPRRVKAKYYDLNIKKSYAVCL